MKNSDLQGIKPIYIHDTSCSTGDEISLIDITTVLVRRKVLIAYIFIVFTMLGVSIALFTQKTYTNSTTVEIGSQIIGGIIKPFESPETLLAKMQHVFIPQTLNEQQQANPENKKRYKVKASIPKGSVIIILEIKGTEDEAGLLKNLLRSITEKAIIDHSRIYDAVRENITIRLKQATSELQTLNKSNDNETKAATQQNLIETYSSQLSNLRHTHEVLPPMKSLEPTGTSKKLIVIIAVFAGVFLGILSAFFAEFIPKVKQRIREEGEA